MKLLLNSELFPIISVAMYGTHIEPSSMFDDYQINQDFDEGYVNYNSEYFWENFNNSAFEKHIENSAKNFLNGKVENNGLSIKIEVGSIYSPREYNFANDNIDLTVTYNKSKLLKYAKANQSEFSKFLKDNYSSYDGFISFTANNINDWLVDYADNDVQAVGAILTFIFGDTYKNDDYVDQFTESVLENTFYSEFCDDAEIENELERLNNYIKSNYIELDIDNLTFESDLIDEERIKNLVKAQINRIENNTLSLF